MYLKVISTFAFLFLSFTSILAQIGQSRDDIIAEYGQHYEVGETNDGIKYISYDKEYTTEQSGTYIQAKAIYFFEADDGTHVCHKWLIIEPSSETNSWVKLLNKDFVKIGYMEWKDYESNILYKIEVEDGLCLLKAMYDFDKK